MDHAQIVIPEPASPRRWNKHRMVAAFLAATVTAGFLQAPEPAEAVPAYAPATPVEKDEPVVAGNFKTRATPPRPKVPTTPPSAAWPRGATADISFTGKSVDIGGLRIATADRKQLQRSTRADATTNRKLRVEVLDQVRTRAAGIDGVLLRVARPSDGDTDLTIGYADIARVYGGDYGARLRLVRVPDCSATGVLCTSRAEVTHTNDPAAQTITATLSSAEPAIALFALTADDSSSQGSYAATSLSPSSQWNVSPNAGNFAWSYPLRVPPVPGGLQPELALSYNSQNVDGRTSLTNNQSSWVGEGFDYSVGFIERRYRSCDDDGHKDVVDLCWARNAVSVSLGGRSGELVQDDKSGEWRIAKDDGSKVEHLTESDIGNGDDNGEYWRLTTSDGTPYWFGRNRLPGWTSGMPETNSTWVVPVYGDDTDEPCNKDTFADSACDQAWRWNLDYVVDPHGNVMTLHYEKEKNSYAFAGKTDVNGRRYDRGGYLKYIDYGQRAGEVYTGGLAPARVAFTSSERCIVSASACTTDKLNKDTALNWPDTPFDRNCNADTKCSKEQKAPSFWSRIRLTEVTAQIKASATGYTDVEKWTIDHTFTDNGDGSHSLWPYQITHVGLVGDDITLPATTLGPILLENRIDDRDNKPDGLSPLVRPRLATIDTESGSHTFIDYADPDCTATDVPAVGKSTRRCFPVKWTPSGNQDPITDWFHKYVVEETKISDPVAGSDQMVTRYQYVGDAGWRYSAPDGVTLDKYRSWGDWRGYQHVKVTGGDGATMTTRTDSFFLRGLDGDKNPDGGTRPVTVKDSTGKEYTDRDEYAGLPLESIVYDGTSVVRKEINEPWSTATAIDQYAKGDTEYDWGSLRAWVARSQTTRGYIAKENGGWREMKAAQKFDAQAGRVTELEDLGDLATEEDDRCTTTAYADDVKRWMRMYPSQVITMASSCTRPANPVTQTISDVRSYYDGSDVLGALTGAGDATKTTSLADHTASTANYLTTATKTYDVFGRVKSATDAEGGITGKTYFSNNGLTTRIDTSNPEAHTSSVTYSPEWGLPLQETDANSKVTVNAYDSLGRISKIWLPDRRSTTNPSIKYTYAITKTKATYIKTERINNSGGYRSEFEIYDGLLRSRQVQKPAPDGGRQVADTFHTATGQVKRQNEGYYAAGPASGELLDEDEIRSGEVDGQILFRYDGADRVIAEIFAIAGDERWRTTTRHGGDRVHVDPPVGGTPTTTFQDAQGHTTEVWQYRDAERKTGFDRILYDYNASGQLESVTDAADHHWSFTYDLLGRKLTAVDPDAGTSEFKYDRTGRLTWMKTGAGDHLYTTFDKLGRRTAVYIGDDDKGIKIAGWKYDTYYKGQLSYSQRFDSGNTYSILYPLRDFAYRPTLTRYVIPAGENKLAGTYDFTRTWNPDGTLQAGSSPITGDLPAETVRYGYDDLQRQTTVTGSMSPYLTGTLLNYSGAPTRLSLSTGTTTTAELTLKYERGTSRLQQATTKSRVGGALATQADLAYTYDNAGNILSIEDAPQNGRHEKQCFTYDYLQRLTDAWASDTTAQDCSVNPDDAATLDGPAPYWTSYAYDAAGSRQEETVHDVDGDDDVLLRYLYPDDVQRKTLTSVERKTSDGQITTSGYAYDTGGNTIKRPGHTAEQRLTWNAEGRLQEIDEGGRITSYVYDADGNRLLRKQPGTHTLYLPNAELELDTATGRLTGTRHHDLGAGTVAVRTATGVTFTVADHQGTAILAINAVTGEATRRRTTPFGAMRGSQPTAGTWPNQRGFLSGAADEAEGLTHLGAREYDTSIGRFVSPDPIIDYTQPQQIHGYTYANNNPVTLSDPAGENPLFVWEIYQATQAALKTYYDAGTKVKGSVTDHDVAIRVRVTNLRHNYPLANFKFDYKNQYHGADIICYDCAPGEIWVWEVKPVGKASDGDAQLGGYITNLKQNIGSRPSGKEIRIVRGPVGAFKPTEEYALASNGYDEVLKVWSHADGIELYEVHKGDKKAPREAFGWRDDVNEVAAVEDAKQQQDKYELNAYGPKDAGAVQSDPVADALIIGPIGIGFGACFVYCGGGAVMGGVAAGVKWVIKHVKPGPKPRKCDYDLCS